MLSRAEVSARLKAARWLAAERVDRYGNPVALSIEELLEREPVKGNFTKNRLAEIEQTKTDARTMELEKLADAFGLPHAWFTAELHELVRPDIAAEKAAALLAALSTEPESPLSPPTEGDLGPGGELRRELLGGSPSPSAPDAGDAQQGRRRRRGEDA